MGFPMSDERLRQRRRNLTDRQVAALPRKRRRYTVTDPESRGHYLRVPPSGPVSFAAVAAIQRQAGLGDARHHR